MRVPNIQVPPVGMRVPITPKDLVAPDSVPRKKPQEESKGELDMNVQDELKALKQRIAELEQQVEQEKEFPQDGDKYWFMSDSGGAIDTSFYSNYYIDNDRIDIGNFFKGREHAEFAVEKLKVEAELRKFSRPFKRDNQNYCIELCSPYKSISAYSYEQSQMQGVIYFESLEKAQQAVNKVGEYRIKKYIFGVED